MPDFARLSLRYGLLCSPYCGKAQNDRPLCSSHEMTELPPMQCKLVIGELAPSSVSESFPS